MRSGPRQSQDLSIDVVASELTPFTVNYGRQSAVIVPNIGVWRQPLRNFSVSLHRFRGRLSHERGLRHIATGR